MRSNGSASSQSWFWVRVVAGAGCYCRDPPVSCTGAHQEMGSASHHCPFLMQVFSHLLLKDLYHMHFGWYFSLSSLGKGFVGVAVWQTAEMHQRAIRKRPKCCGVAEIHVSVNAAKGGLWPCCDPAGDRQSLSHVCIRTKFHFLSGCLILPQWHLEHSSCSETPKQTGCVPGPQAGF